MLIVLKDRGQTLRLYNVKSTQMQLNALRVSQRREMAGQGALEVRIQPRRREVSVYFPVRACFWLKSPIGSGYWISWLASCQQCTATSFESPNDFYVS